MYSNYCFFQTPCLKFVRQAFCQGSGGSSLSLLTLLTSSRGIFLSDFRKLSRATEDIIVYNRLSSWLVNWSSCVKPAKCLFKMSKYREQKNSGITTVDHMTILYIFLLYHSIAVTTATISLWLKNLMKHLSSRGPYLSSRKAANSASLLSPYKSHSSLHLLNDAPLLMLVFSLAWSNYFFLQCFCLSGFLFFLLTWAMVGHFLALLLLSVLCHCLHFEFKLEHVWPGGAGTAPAWGMSTAQYCCQHKNDWHFSDIPLGFDWLCWSRNCGFLQKN